MWVVPVDDASLQQGSWFEQNRQIPDWARDIGTLPWPRAAYGKVAARLLAAGAAPVAALLRGPPRRLALTLVRPEPLMAALGGREALGLTNTPVQEPGERRLHPDA